MSARPEPTTPAVALEGSARPASLAAACGERVLQAELDEQREHASDLVPQIEALLRDLGTTAAELRLVVVGLGPGSYTGLRVAAATGQGLALGSGAAVIGVPSFEALAYGALREGESADILVDAHGGHLYHARYTRSADDVIVAAPPSALTSEEARASLTASVWLADEDALVAAGLGAAPTGVRIVHGARASAADLLALGQRRFRSTTEPRSEALSPLYLRSFTPKVRAR
ncbi:MAG: tRNA (adenosine(37)-N6)-threonylcarbamoyltransferase complex dimerization subunit type 1 TsaB [Planctomycetota bacterium]